MKLIAEIEHELPRRFPIKLGVNKKSELVRLCFEICFRDGLGPAALLDSIGANELSNEKGRLFYRIKERLLRSRFPSISKDDDPALLPLKLKKGDGNVAGWNFKFEPIRIFAEKEALSSTWTERFISNFPEAEIKEIDSIGAADGLAGKDHVKKYNERLRNIFIVRSKNTFIKKCPCTKSYKRCGYWILDLSFGCPFDCSYCFLQAYSNSPGLIFPSNIEDCLEELSAFDRKLTARTRIGTGEFADSLALDGFTGYSAILVPFFSKLKNLVLELKTKAADISALLRAEPNDNVVAAWSVNTERIASRYEIGSSSVAERISAAAEAAKKGFKIGFHFDPIVHYENWENDYRETVERMFAHDALRKNTRWVSLGTLRYMPDLKQTAERRFSDNSIFYEGEFFKDSDGKMRYPKKIREDIYGRMASWIRKCGASAWIYLCMEPDEMWRKAGL